MSMHSAIPARNPGTASSRDFVEIGISCSVGHTARVEGRGSHYGSVRAFAESVLRTLYRGDWPARLWALYPRACEVTVVRHRVPILPPSAAAIRIGFISDIHIGPTTPNDLIDAAATELAAADLDVLLLGGDYVFLDATSVKAERLAALVEKIPARRKFAVLGNHDLWTRHDLLERSLSRAGVELLNNQSASLAAPHAGVAIVGFDEPWTGSIDAPAALRGIDGAETLVMLCHSPDGLPFAERALAELPNSPPALFVCGHTHGGQIATAWGPVLIPGAVGKKYPHGFHEISGAGSSLYLHVSRGVGTTELPIRSYAAPEVAVFDLIAREPA
jgi:predicted MPP superfamily phosphohydrolase